MSRRTATRHNAMMAARIGAYQLYHVLNHINLFGRSYVAQAKVLVRRLR